jgi:hypothetical protein
MNKTAFTQRQKEIPEFEVSVFVPPQWVPWPLKLAHWALGSAQHLLYVLSFYVRTISDHNLRNSTNCPKMVRTVES